MAPAHFQQDQEGAGRREEEEKPEEENEVSRQGGGGQELGEAEEREDAVVPLPRADEEAHRRDERQQVHQRGRPRTRQPGAVDRGERDTERQEAAGDPGRERPAERAGVQKPAEGEDDRKEGDGGGGERPGRGQRAETGPGQAIGGHLETAPKGHSWSKKITCADRHTAAGKVPLGRGVRMIL